MDRLFTKISSRIAACSGQPIAFIVALALMLAWGASGPFFHYSDTWQLVVNTSTTIVTFLMVFLIQNSQNRDGAAIQAKLDEIIRAMDSARSQFIGIEHHTDKEIQGIRKELEEECGEDARTASRPPRKASNACSNGRDTGNGSFGAGRRWHAALECEDVAC